MLEHSLWTRYNGEKTIREALSAIYRCDPVELSDDEGQLYAALKRHLTKRELRLFVMNEGGEGKEAIMEEVGIDPDSFDTVKHKTYRKIKQDKIRGEARMLLSGSIE